MDRLYRRENNQSNDEKRVIMLDFRIPPEIELKLTDTEKVFMWNGGNENNMVMYWVLEKVRFQKVIDDVRSRFKGKNIGLRGVMASVGDDLEGVWYGNQQITVANVEHVLEAGTEHIGRDTVLIAPVGLAEELNEIPSRVNQYFANSIKVIMAKEPRNYHLRKQLRPSILVYDLSPESEVECIDRGYEHQLPDGELRSKAILGIYPIEVSNLLPPITIV